ncbi:hypothetical protein [Aquimarina latercula]|uniref:hypothetical protein n=1 Tax=Aquimarina latercula TaxID=987 RepID=UPI0003FFD241|nr:hypothetical protein [Aquimarina latercula]
MEYLKLASVVLGAHGLWKLAETLLQHRTQKKFKKAEINNLNVQANDVVISNLLKWSEKMEVRIDELEKNNKEMKAIIVKQRKRISDLEVYTEKLEHKLKKHEEKNESR